LFGFSATVAVFAAGLVVTDINSAQCSFGGFVRVLGCFAS
jgi:hypothetical protein